MAQRDARYYELPSGLEIRRGDTATNDLLNRFGDIAQYESITPGKRFANGQFVVTGGSGYESDWGSYNPGDGYEKLGDYGRNAMVWFRAGQPQAAPPPPPTARSQTDPSVTKGPTPLIPSGKYRYTDPGDKGFFGMKDYEELKGQGANDDEIRSYAQMAQFGVGPAVASMLGLQPYTVTKPTAKPGDQTYQMQIQSLQDQIKQIQTEPAKPAEMPAPAEPLMIVNSNSSVSGNATGFTRAQSAARKANLTSKGSSRLRIKPTGQTSASSGLNIGV